MHAAHPLLDEHRRVILLLVRLFPLHVLADKHASGPPLDLQCRAVLHLPLGLQLLVLVAGPPAPHARLDAGRRGILLGEAYRLRGRVDQAWDRLDDVPPLLRHPLWVQLLHEVPHYLHEDLCVDPADGLTPVPAERFQLIAHRGVLLHDRELLELRHEEVTVRGVPGPLGARGVVQKEGLHLHEDRVEVAGLAVHRADCGEEATPLEEETRQ